MESLVVAQEVLVAACGIQFPDQGSNGVSAIGPRESPNKLAFLKT